MVRSTVAPMPMTEQEMMAETLALLRAVAERHMNPAPAGSPSRVWQQRIRRRQRSYTDEKEAALLALGGEPSTTLVIVPSASFRTRVMLWGGSLPPADYTSVVGQITALIGEWLGRSEAPIDAPEPVIRLNFEMGPKPAAIAALLESWLRWGVLIPENGELRYTGQLRLPPAMASQPYTGKGKQEAEISARLGQPMIHIPPGPFLMGDDPVAHPAAGYDEIPLQEVTLPEYWIGRYAVTNEQYARFVEAGGYETEAYWEHGGWSLAREMNGSGQPWRHPEAWKDPLYNQPRQPVVAITIYEAMAYCAWLSQQSGLSVIVPTEAQWEKAARGTDGRRYPWGDEPPTSKHAHHDRDTNPSPFPVGSFSPLGDSPYGCADMMGNCWQWTRSPARPYPYDPVKDSFSHYTVVARGSLIYTLAYGSQFGCASRHTEPTSRSERDGVVYRQTSIGFRIAVEEATTRE